MLKLTLDNPVVAKEFRSRMRGSRAYWMLFGYLGLLSATLFIAYLLWWQTERYALMSGGGGMAAYTIGRTFFQVVFSVQAVLIMLITPALTAGAISLEREQRTFELLRTTTLPPRRIVLGKLAASVSFIVLLLTASLPLVSLCFLLGGVSPGEVFWAYLLLVCDAFLFGTVGLAWSAHAATTSAATALSYGTLVLFFIATISFAAPVVTGYGLMMSGTGNTYLSALNPIGAVFAAVVPERYFGWRLPAWLPALLLNGTLGIVLLLACINKLDDFPARRAAPLRLAALTLFVLILFFGNGIFWSRPSGASLTGSALLTLTALLIFVPLMATGDGESETTGQSETRADGGNFLTRGRLRDGLPYGLALTAAGILLFVLSAGTHLRGHEEAAATAAALLGAVAFGMGGLGRALSVLTGNRWTSVTLLLLLGVVLMAIPFFTYATLTDIDAARAASSPLVVSLYFCPFISLIEIFSGVTRVRSSYPVMVGLPGGGAGMGFVTATLYVLLGLTGLQLTNFVTRRLARENRKAEEKQASKTA